MTSKERAALGNYCRAIADAIELRDWTFTLMAEPCGADALATIQPIYGRKLAEIYFGADFRALDPEKQRHTVVHELVHCHIEAAANMVYKDLEEFLGKQSDQIFWNGFRRQVEYAVDGLAAALAKHLPLIDWSKTSA